MRRLTSAAIVLFVCAVAGLAAAPQSQDSKDTSGKKYGTALTLTEVTKISDIYANPDTFAGKRVQVEGPVVDVCAEMGCWLALGGDKESQVLRFKVEDGVIVFPMTAKGKKAKVEGIVTVTKGTETTVQIKGEGAIVY
jgi:hypothetical protein